MIGNGKMENGFEEWQKGFEGLDFEGSARRVKDKLIESPEIDDLSRRCFSDSFEYVMNLYKQGKGLEPNLLRIHLTKVKDYENIRFEDFTRILMLLSLCGFGFDFSKIEKG